MDKSEKEKIIIGNKLAEVLNLKAKTILNQKRYSTTWGSKTELGLYYTIKGILENDNIPEY